MKHTWKRLWAGLLTAAMLLSLLPVLAVEEEPFTVPEGAVQIMGKQEPVKEHYKTVQVDVGQGKEFDPATTQTGGYYYIVYQAETQADILLAVDNPWFQVENNETNSTVAPIEGTEDYYSVTVTFDALKAALVANNEQDGHSSDQTEPAAITKLGFQQRTKYVWNGDKGENDEYLPATTVHGIWWVPPTGTEEPDPGPGDEIDRTDWVQILGEQKLDAWGSNSVGKPDGLAIVEGGHFRVEYVSESGPVNIQVVVKDNEEWKYDDGLTKESSTSQVLNETSNSYYTEISYDEFITYWTTTKGFTLDQLGEIGAKNGSGGAITLTGMWWVPPAGTEEPDPSQGHTVTFSGGHVTVTVDDSAVTSAEVADGESLSFRVAADTDYTLNSVKVGDNDVSESGGVYTLSGVTDDATVTISVAYTPSVPSNAERFTAPQGWACAVGEQSETVINHYGSQSINLSQSFSSAVMEDGGYVYLVYKAKQQATVGLILESPWTQDIEPDDAGAVQDTQSLFYAKFNYDTVSTAFAAKEGSPALSALTKMGVQLKTTYGGAVETRPNILLQGIWWVPPQETVTFTYNTAHVTVKVGGAALEGTTATVYKGQELAFTLEAQEGYELTGVTVDGEPLSAGVDGTYTIENITADKAVEISTQAQGDTPEVKHTVTFQYDDAKVTLSGVSLTDKTVTVDNGGSLTFTLAVPGADEDVGAVTVDDQAISPDAQGSYTLSGITGDKTVVITVVPAVTLPDPDTAAWSTADFKGRPTLPVLKTGSTDEYEVNTDPVISDTAILGRFQDDGYFQLEFTADDLTDLKVGLVSSASWSELSTATFTKVKGTADKYVAKFSYADLMGRLANDAADLSASSGYMIRVNEGSQTGGGPITMTRLAWYGELKAEEAPAPLNEPVTWTAAAADIDKNDRRTLPNSGNEVNTENILGDLAVGSLQAGGYFQLDFTAESVEGLSVGLTLLDSWTNVPAAYVFEGEQSGHYFIQIPFEDLTNVADATGILIKVFASAQPITITDLTWHGALKTNAVTFSAANATVRVDNETVTAPVNVPYGKSLSFTVAANAGYQLLSVSDGANTLTAQNGTYTLTNVTAPVTVTVTVEQSVDDPYVDASVSADSATAIAATADGLTVNGVAAPYAAAVSLVDPAATAPTVSVYKYLRAVGGADAVIFGQMEDTVYKAGAASLSNSDVKDLTGSVSGIIGLDCGDSFAGLPTQSGESGIQAAARISNEAIRGGAIMTLSVHMPNFVTGGDSTDTTACASAIVPGGAKNADYTAYLDMIADYAGQVEGAVLFRPFHENTGSWFWWGAEHCTADEYKALWQYTVTYLRDTKGVHNLIYVYSPGTEAADAAAFAARYPGDEWVDVIGFDTYVDGADASMTAFANYADMVSAFAQSHDKVFAVTELGVSDLKDKTADDLSADWFSQVLNILSARKCAFFMTWTNRSAAGEFYVPFAASKADGVLHGHWMMDGFITFYNNAKSIFAKDQRDALGYRAPAVWESDNFKGRATLPCQEEDETKTNTDSLTDGLDLACLDRGGYFQLELEADSLDELNVGLVLSNGWKEVQAKAADNAFTKVEGTEKTYVATYTFEALLAALKEQVADATDLAQADGVMVRHNGGGTVTLKRLAWYGELKTPAMPVPVDPAPYADAAWTTTDFGGKESLTGNTWTENIMGDFPLDCIQSDGYFQLELTCDSTNPKVQFNLLEGWKGIDNDATYAGESGGRYKYFVTIPYSQLVEKWEKETLSGVTGFLIKNQAAEGQNPLTLTRLSWFGTLSAEVKSDSAGQWEFTAQDTQGWTNSDETVGVTPTALGDGSYVLMTGAELADSGWEQSTLQNSGAFHVPENNMVSLDAYFQKDSFDACGGTKSLKFSGGWGKLEVTANLGALKKSTVSIGGKDYYKFELNMPFTGGGQAVSPLVVQFISQGGAYSGNWGIADVSIQKNGGTVLEVETTEKTESDLYFKFEDGQEIDMDPTSSLPVLDLTAANAAVETKAFEIPAGSSKLLGDPKVDLTLARGGLTWSKGSIQVTVHINKGDPTNHDSRCVVTLRPENFSAPADPARAILAEAKAVVGGRTTGSFDGGTWTAEPGEQPGTTHITASYTSCDATAVHSVTLEVANAETAGDACDFRDTLRLEKLSMTNATITTTPINSGSSGGSSGGVGGGGLAINTIPYTFQFGTNGLDNWAIASGWEYQYSGIKNTTLRDVDKMMRVEVDYSEDKQHGWSQLVLINENAVLRVKGANHLSLDLMYDPAKLDGELLLYFCSSNGLSAQGKVVEGSESEVKIDGTTYKKVKLDFTFTKITSQQLPNMLLQIIGRNITYKGYLFLSNMTIDGDAPDPYVDATGKAKTATRVFGGRNALSVNGKDYPYASEVRLVDPDADAATVALYRYLKAVGQSDAALYGHMEDSVLKAGNNNMSYSDTKDLTGSYAAIDGLDCGGLFSGYADKYKARHPGAYLPSGVTGDIRAAALLTNESIEQGTIMTLSMHMPNFAYATLVNSGAAKTYMRYSYPADSYTLTGNPMVNILPGGAYHDAFTAYLDLVAEYAHQVDGPILFRPFHENTGSWFWWGKAFCDAETYKSVYKYTVEYLRDEKDVHNFIYVYGPGSEAATQDDYALRYPGDAYVDMVGFDTYDNATSPADTANFMKSFARSVELTDQFAKEHGKLFAVTETGINNMPTKQPEQLTEDWFDQVQDIITAPGIDCVYYLTWSNYSTEGFFTPYVAYTENKVLHGHFMMDPFISFYNRADTIFANDQKQAVTTSMDTPPSVTGWGPSGYITAPVGGRRVLEPMTVTARLSQEGMNVSFVISNGAQSIPLTTTVDGKSASAPITAEQLQAMGETVDGVITLYMGEQVLCRYSIIFNVPEEVRDPLVVDDFHSYYGNSDLLASYWSTNMATGSDIELKLVSGPGKAQTGHGMSFHYTEPVGGWAGATVNKQADWSSCDALQFWTVPDGKQQKTVIQIKANGKVYEMYMNLYDEYNALAGKPVLVTLPFSQIKEQNTEEKNFVENCSKITEFGLWVNAIDNEFMVDGVVSGTILYDDIHVIQGGGDEITFMPASGRFIDVAPYAWYYSCVESAAEQGLMNGVGGDAFAPDLAMTRAMMAQVLYNMAGRPDAAADGSFADVPADQWYAPAVTWAHQSGIVQGYGDGTYGPNDTLSREQAVSFLYGYAALQSADLPTGGLSAFPDADAVSAWATQQMSWAVAAGVVNGTGDGRLDPQGAVTRAQMAALLTRFVALGK